MTYRLTESDLALLGRKLMGRALPKYRNRKVEFGGHKFDSQHEFERWRDFETQRLAGKIRGVVRQVSLPLAGGRRRIRIDFLIVHNSGSVEWFDAKGFATETWKLKQALMRETYGIEIATC